MPAKHGQGHKEPSAATDRNPIGRNFSPRRKVAKKNKKRGVSPRPRGKTGIPVTAIVDSTRDVVERYSYTPYGEATVLNPDFSAVAGNVSAISNELLYTGRRLDPETGLQLNRNRFYDAPLGRWVNRDPLQYFGGMNLYGYVDGMPAVELDPFGEIGLGK